MTRLLPLLALATAACSATSHPQHAYALDGDTFDAGGVRYRLARIDAPEMPNHPCRPGRRCVDGDPYLAKAALQRLLDRGDVSCETVDHDRYGRTIAECAAGGENIGDALLASGVVQLYGSNRR